MEENKELEFLNNETAPSNFILDFIDEDLKEGVYDRVQTRFPPEPNGYLHIGHAKAICIDFGTAEKYGGICNLRLDDTNPTKEDVEYVDAIKEDIKWLGFNWDNIYYASDYFDYIYDCALYLIDKGLAFVDESSPEKIREMRGTLTQAGTESPYRDRPIEENRDLLLLIMQEQMKDKGILFVSHDVAALKNLCQNVYVLGAGKIIEHGTMDKLLSSPQTDWMKQFSALSHRESRGEWKWEKL